MLLAWKIVISIVLLAVTAGAMTVYQDLFLSDGMSRKEKFWWTIAGWAVAAPILTVTGSFISQL